jgi:hypothetical protein
MISTCDCNNFFVASFFSSLVVLIDSEELEEEEDEIGENLLSFPEEDFVDDFFDGDDVKSVAFFFSLLLDEVFFGKAEKIFSYFILFFFELF